MKSFSSLLRTWPPALVLVLGACQKQAPQFTPQDEATVRAIFDSVVADLHANNLDAWAGRFADDARFYFPNQPVLVGRTAILAWGKSLPHMTSFSLGPVDVSGDGSLAYGSSRVFLQMENVPADSSKQLVVFRRDASGKWWVQACAVSSDLPLPSATPAARPRRS
jgi:ketosteroid isomerase-like protein